MNKVLNTYEQQGQFKNKVINGDFDIWQRGSYFTVNGYVADRWNIIKTGTDHILTKETFTLGQTDVPDYPGFYARCNVTSSAGASNQSQLNQRIEGVSTFASEEVTFTFWAKADSAKDIAVNVSQFFGTGGSPSSTAFGDTSTHTLSTAWQKFSMTTVIPSVSGKTLGTNGDDYLVFTFYFDAGSTLDSVTNSLGQQSGIFDIAHVQLERGPVATDFEKRHVGQELQMCQRYFCKTFPQGQAPVDNPGVGFQGAIISTVSNVLNHLDSWYFPVEMRTTATVTFYNPGAGATNNWRNTNDTFDIAVGGGGVQGSTKVSRGPASVPGNYLGIHATADAEL
jgi:hypothetical protein